MERSKLFKDRCSRSFRGRFFQIWSQISKKQNGGPKMADIFFKIYIFESEIVRIYIFGNADFKSEFRFLKNKMAATKWLTNFSKLLRILARFGSQVYFNLQKRNVKKNFLNSKWRIQNGS